MQNIWDSYKDKSKINLILCGSIFSLMKNIFENSKEPLFGRATERIHLRPFNVITLKEILADNYPKFKAEDLLAFYTFTGGVEKTVKMTTYFQSKLTTHCRSKLTTCCQFKMTSGCRSKVTT